MACPMLWLCLMSKPIGGQLKRPARVIAPIAGKATPHPAQPGKAEAKKNEAAKARGTPEQELQRKCANVYPEASQRRCVDEFVRGESDRMMKQGSDLARRLGG